MLDTKKFKIFAIIGLLLLYLLMTNWIQTQKLYPWNPDWFDYNFHQKYAPQDCFFVHPSYIDLWSKEKLLSHWMTLEKRCEFSEAIISIYITGLKDFKIKNSEGLPINRNLSEPNRVVISINSSDMVKGKGYDFRLLFVLNESFYNFYTFSSEGYEIAHAQIVIDNSISGYNCGGESCFSVLEGKLEREVPLWRGITKEYRFNKTDRVKIRFSPISNGWFLTQKVLDVIILGIIVVLIYGLFESFLNRGRKVTDIEYGANLSNGKMNKENLKKIVKIMEELENSDGKSITEKILVDKFGAQQFNWYKTYCDGNDRKYVVERTGFLSLTQLGSHELYRLRQELRQIEILEQQTLFNKLLTFFTAFLAVGVVFSYTVGKNYPPLAALIATFAIVGSAVLLYVLGKGIVKKL